MYGSLNCPTSESDIRDSACFKMNHIKNICMWWLEDLQYHEDFNGLYEVDVINANSLVHAPFPHEIICVVDSAMTGCPT